MNGSKTLFLKTYCTEKSWEKVNQSIESLSKSGCILEKIVIKTERKRFCFLSYDCFEIFFKRRASVKESINDKLLIYLIWEKRGLKKSVALKQWRLLKRFLFKSYALIHDILFILEFKSLNYFLFLNHKFLFAITFAFLLYLNVLKVSFILKNSLLFLKDIKTSEKQLIYC